MIKNYFKIAFRNIKRQKLYSSINIFGLAMGMAVTIIILLYVQNELIYDSFNVNAKRTYRIIEEFNSTSQNMKISALTPNPMASALMSEFPEVEVTTRFRKAFGGVTIRCGNIFQNEKLVAFADSNFFKIFSIPFVAGDPKNALDDPYSLVITEEVAEKYFGKIVPIGQIITVTDSWRKLEKKDFKITGVIKLPENFHLKFDFLGSFASIEKTDNYSWNSSAFNTYVMLKNGSDPKLFEEKIKPFFMSHIAEESKKYYSNAKFLLQPLLDIHFSTSSIYESADTNNIKYIYLLSILTVLILLLACFNYMNLSTARFSLRIKEIGLRKVIGANRLSLISQFLSESVLISIFALLISLLLVELLLPAFNQLVEKNISLLKSKNILFNMSGIFGVTVITGILSGSYPSLFLSSFEPTKILGGTLKSGSFKSKLRNLLVTFQFCISIFLFSSFVVILMQQNYLKNTNLGFNKENVIILSNVKWREDEKVFTFKNELLRNSNIQSVTVAEGFPGISAASSNRSVFLDSINKRSELQVDFYRGDFDFINTFGMKIIMGRNFSKDNLSDRTQSFILNEEAVKLFKWDNPLGKELKWEKGYIRAIGVVEDFHYISLHEKIKPLVICLDDLVWTSYVSIRINASNIPQSISAIEKKWSEFYPEQPFEYSFLDEDLNKIYKNEERLSRIFGYTTIFAMFIALIGLLGLVSYSVEQRIKEIGIRKILGISISQVVYLLNKDFIKLILIANFITLPLAYYVMNKYLQDFAYRIELNILIFILTGGFILAISLIMVSFQTIKTALMNPVDALRSE